MQLGFFAITIAPHEMDRLAREVEEAGADMFAAAEIRHDPFVGLGVAARASQRLALRTAVAVAFARNPMSTAVSANDLQLLSRGRFSLGLGSQLKAHITRRYSMPWHAPAAQMRDYVQAVRAIWRSFETGERLRHRGEFYRHTLMAPFFDPGPNPFGNPPILLGGVGRVMTELAGEIADGFIAHNIVTRPVLDAVTLPALRRGRDRAQAAGTASDGFELHVMPMVAIGRDETELAGAVRRIREQVAFYAAAPAYADVLEVHGLSEARDDLHRLASQGRTGEMPDVIDDSVLEKFAFAGEPGDVAVRLLDQFGDVAASMSFYDSGVTTVAHWAPLYRALRELGSRTTTHPVLPSGPTAVINAGPGGSSPLRRRASNAAS